MREVTIISIRPPALNAKGDQLVLWMRIQALIKAKINVNLILFSSPNEKTAESIINNSFVRLINLNHGIVDVIKSLLLTAFTALPFDARLFKSNRLNSILNRNMLGDNNIIVFYTSRLWPSVRQFGGKNVYADLIDSFSLNYSRRPGFGLFKIFNRLQEVLHKKLENEILLSVNKAFVVSKIDAEWLGSANVSVIPNGVMDLMQNNDKKRSKYTIGFLGNMNYGPNKRAIVWFATEVLPIILKYKPEARLLVAGNNSEMLRKILPSHTKVLGPVASQFEFFSEVSVAVAPMLDGSGMQNKVLEAMIVATPVVATSIASLPITSSTSSVLLVADDKFKFARHVLDLFENDQLSDELGIMGRKFVLENYSWDKINSLFLREINV